MPFVVIYDANVLYPSTLRDLLIRVAQAGLVQARWTHRILDETFDSIKKNRPELPVTALERTRELVICCHSCTCSGDRHGKPDRFPFVGPVGVGHRGQEPG